MDRDVKAVFFHNAFEFLHEFLRRRRCLHGRLITDPEILHCSEIVIGEQLEHSDSIAQLLAELRSLSDVVLIIIE